MLAILRLLAKSGNVSGSVKFDECDLLSLSTREMRSIRGKKIGMIFQDPMTSLNPSIAVGRQLIESVLTHQKISSKLAAKRAAELLDTVAIPQPSAQMLRYPHELSGGMRQRVMIAMAIANDPELLIADEPTTALDVTIQAQILDVLKNLRDQRNLSIVLITHDLGVVAGIADTVNVMYSGRIVETGDVDGVFHKSTHPYTRGLLACIPRLDSREAQLVPIGGDPPRLTTDLQGCAFEPRCKNASDQCRAENPTLLLSERTNVSVSCHNPVSIETSELS
jgi:oligopeptide/dipeptide ABC transporter ATP-binding protein